MNRLEWNRSEDVTEIRHMRVLVVDDYIDNVESMATLLRMSGYEVAGALSGTAALQSAIAHAPDAVLCDIAMPGMSGYEVARKLRQMFHEKVLLVAITAYGSEEAKKECKEAGFDRHFVKPTDFADVEGVLRERLCAV